MWIFTRYGFFSAVCAREGDGQHGNPVDPNRIMVRARVRGHLEALIQAFPDNLASVSIIKTPKTDYRFRIFVPKDTWTMVMTDLVQELDYDNFKSAAGRKLGHHNPYIHTLHEVWSAGLRMQEGLEDEE